jgi:hypothetical protein
MNHSYNLHKKLYATFKSTGTHDQRHDLIYKFTKGRTQNSAELSQIEVLELIAFLNNESHAQRDRMIKKIYYLAHSYGWQKYDPYKGREVVDGDILHPWVLKYGYLHKPLVKYETKELPKLITQLEKAVNQHLSKV